MLFSNMKGSSVVCHVPMQGRESTRVAIRITNYKHLPSQLEAPSRIPNPEGVLSSRPISNIILLG